MAEIGKGPGDGSDVVTNGGGRVPGIVIRAASEPPLDDTLPEDHMLTDTERRQSAYFRRPSVADRADYKRGRRKQYAAVVIVFILLVLIFSVPFFGRRIRRAPATFHYAVVIDAGSSGSRAYLYGWPTHSGNKHDLLDIRPLSDDRDGGKPIYKKVKPGLSSLKDQPHEALEYISPLLDFALEHVPSEQVYETPVYILATAGMRMIEARKRDDIISHLRAGVNSKYGFLFPEDNLEIISGKQEGVYQWLAINYVLGKFKHTGISGQSSTEMVALDQPVNLRSANYGEHLIFRPRTVGAIDMGGASMQFAMEITSEQQLQGVSESERSQVEEIKLGCREHDTEHTYRVFVKTFLGYGANEALQRHKRDLLLTQIHNGVANLTGLAPHIPVVDPCLPRDFANTSPLPFHPDAYALPEHHKAQIKAASALYSLGTGEWDACYESLKEFTKSREKFSNCETAAHCPDAGIKVPTIQFGNSEFFAFSEFWYSMEDVLKMGGRYLPSKFKNAAKSFCETPWSVSWMKWQDGDYPTADQMRMETQCFKSAWLGVALHEGFAFPEDYDRLSAAPETVNGKVVHWTIGALLYRTRFLPLSSIVNESSPFTSYARGYRYYSWSSATNTLYTNYVMFSCVLLVLAGLMIYLFTQKKHSRQALFKRQRSMPASTDSFWSDLAEQGKYSFWPASASEDDIGSMKISPALSNLQHRRTVSLPRELPMLLITD